ncbi:MAG: RHS repeat-associated core domain-containing protein [Acidobacteriota bacterium]|nr:RHS repeat-associated core domain-containing protein [Acidobacteriota bacterium]
MNTANYNSYLTQMIQSHNPSGPAGALPLQAADPIASSSVVGGISAFLDSRQFGFTAPVLSLAGRAGLNVSLGLSYSSKVWVKDTATNTMVFNADRGFPAPGWRTGFGAIQIHTNATGPYFNSTTGKYSIIYLEPNGTRRDMALNSSTGLYESYDSSYMKFDATAQIMYFPNGTQMKFGAYSYSANNRDFQALPIQIKDRNGNYIDIFYKTLDNEKVVIDYFIDTAGRRVDFAYQGNRLISIGQNRGGTWYYFVRIDYQPIYLQTWFDSSLTTDPPAINGTQVWMPSRVTYPNGTNLRFLYNSYGQMYEISKYAPGVNGQGAERQIALTRFVFPAHHLGLFDFDCPSFLARSEGAENWQDWALSSYGYSASTPTVSDPSGRSFKVTINGLEHKLEMIPFSGEGKIDVTTYEQDAGLAYRSNPRIIERKSFFTQYQQQSLARKTRYSYTQSNGIWLETTKDEYSNETNIYRRTTTTYTSYPTRNIFGLPLQVSVYAGPGTTLMSRFTNAYDQSGAYTDSNNQSNQYLIDATATGVIQHDNTNYGLGMTQRGNLTSVTQHSASGPGSRVIRRTSYDTNGNRRTEADGASNRQEFDYSDYYSNKPGGVGQTHVYLNTAANPYGFKTGAKHDYYNGNTVRSFNLRPGSSTEEQVTESTYDFADRLLQRTRPDGGWTQVKHWDNLLAEVTLQKLDVSGGSDQVRANFQLFDGAGRIWRKASDHPDGIAGKYAAQNFGFDELGHRHSSASAIAVNANWIPSWEDSAWQTTTTTHDQFDRTTVMTRPDGNTIQYTYNGCSCMGSETRTVTDEIGCKIRTVTDIFGRTESVSELDTAPGNPVYDQVNYGYDALDRIVAIVQAKAGGAQYQTRSFIYDGYGRLISETNPESGTITYTYKPNDLVESVSNQRGMTTLYSYNTRNLVTQVAYNDGGATPTSTFSYDDFGSRTSMGDGEGTTTYAYNAYRQLQSETRTFSGIAGKTFPLTYTYNLADQIKSVNYAVQSSGGFAPDLPDQTQVKAPSSNPRPAKKTPRLALSSYSISGTVLRADTNQPLQGVTVTAIRQDDPPLSPYPVQTNASGQYVIEGLEEGLTFNVTASKAGYNFAPSSVTVEMDGDKQVNFTGSIPSATLTASPNPIQVCDGTGQGITTLTWSVTGAGASSVQLRAGAPNGTLVASGGTSGNVTTGKWVTNGTVFYLQNVTGGLPLTSEYTLATVTVATTTQGCPPPASFNKTINYARNNTGVVSGIGTNLLGSDPNATTNVASAIAYRAWNAYRSMNFGNGLRVTNTHNNRMQLTDYVIDTQNGSSTLWQQHYDYYNGGQNNSRIRRVSDDPNFAVYKLYQYDPYNRLQTVLNSNSSNWHAGYTYDEWGNIRTINSAAGGGGTLTYQTNSTGAPTNRLATAGGNSVSYDAAGNMTAMGSQTYSYDAANRLKATGGASNQYGYDGDGKRVRQPGLYYVQSTVLDKVAMEVDANANVQRAYVYLNNKLIALQSTDGNFYWAHADHLNSGRMLTSTAGSMVYRADFDPFGQLTYEWSASGNSNLNSRKFTGFERDATGLDYAQARTYTSGWGRYMQSDPMGAGYRGQKPNPMGAAKPRFPQSHNRYSYVGNDPMTLTDPSGLAIDPCCACPGHDECEGRYPTDCPTGGGGGGSGDECKDCCDNESNKCTRTYIGCSAIAGGALFAGLNNVCGNNDYCRQDKPAYDPEKCNNCKQAFWVVFAAAMAGCTLNYFNCRSDINGKCASKKRPNNTTCKCL